MKYNENDRNAFKEITENPIILDFAECKNCDMVHIILKEKFGLPEHYGKNWDALWDCLRYLWICDGEISVKIQGFYSMSEEIKGFCKPMLKVFEDVHKETPNVTFEIIS